MNLAMELYVNRGEWYEHYTAEQLTLMILCDAKTSTYRTEGVTSYTMDGFQIDQYLTEVNTAVCLLKAQGFAVYTSYTKKLDVEDMVSDLVIKIDWSNPTGYDFLESCIDKSEPHMILTLEEFEEFDRSSATLDKETKVYCNPELNLMWWDACAINHTIPKEIEDKVTHVIVYDTCIAEHRFLKQFAFDTRVGVYK